MNIKKDEIIEMKENINHKQKWKKASYMTNQNCSYEQSILISQKKFYDEVMNFQNTTTQDIDINTPTKGLILEKWDNGEMAVRTELPNC